MKALTIHGTREIHHETVADPTLEAPTDAIVEVQLAGLCGSDLHPYHGRERLDAGTIMGHEFVGEVVETGAEVARIMVGDKVFSPFSTSCGECIFCRSELTSRCVQSQLFGCIETGVGIQGGQAEYVRVPVMCQDSIGGYLAGFQRFEAAPPYGTLIQPANDHAADGPLVRRERLGGLLNYYYREAA